MWMIAIPGMNAWAAEKCLRNTADLIKPADTRKIKKRKLALWIGRADFHTGFGETLQAPSRKQTDVDTPAAHVGIAYDRRGRFHDDWMPDNIGRWPYPRHMPVPLAPASETETFT